MTDVVIPTALATLATSTVGAAFGAWLTLRRDDRQVRADRRARRIDNEAANLQALQDAIGRFQDLGQKLHLTDERSYLGDPTVAWGRHADRDRTVDDEANSVRLEVNILVERVLDDDLRLLVDRWRDLVVRSVTASDRELARSAYSNALELVVEVDRSLGAHLRHLLRADDS